MRDRDVRAAMLRRLGVEHAGESDLRIIEEMDVWSGAVRIDIAVVNGELAGYELKSDRDTLERLPMQADIYSRVFDRVTLVVGIRHAKKATPIIPRWWGITVAAVNADGLLLSTIRQAKLNPNLEPLLIAELLSKDEAISSLDRFGLAKGWRNKSALLVRQRLATALPICLLREQVRECLKTRGRELGQHLSGDFKMAIDAVTNPNGQVAGGGSNGNLIYPNITPTERQCATACIRDDALRMPSELSVHLYRSRASRSNAAAYQKLGLKRVAGGDCEPPSDT
jgi:hypothetical protein